MRLSPVLEISDFRTVFLTRLLQVTALQVQAVIVGWQIYKETGDPLLLGLVGLTEAVPAIGCAFISGHMVDIHRPASIFRLSLLTMFANALLMFSAVSPLFAFSTPVRLALLFLTVFISGAARSFCSPSIFSLIPQVVPRSMLPAAAAWYSSAYQFSSIIGPALGGLVYAELGETAAFGVPALLLGAAFFSGEMLSMSAKALKSEEEHEPFLKSLRAGIRFFLKEKRLLSAMTLDMFSVLFGGAVAVLPVFADQVLHAGPSTLGILRAAPSAGSGLVAVWLAIRPMKVISGQVLLWVVAGFGFSTIGFGLSTNVAMALFFLAAGGAFDGVSMVIRSTILQLLTPSNMRGRVSSLSSVFITSSNEIGAFESGVAARWLGLVPSIVFGGSITLLVVAVTSWLTPELRKAKLVAHEEPNS